MKKKEFYSIITKDHIYKLAKETNLPAFIYFKKIIRNKYNEMLDCLPHGFEIHYAFKANPNRKVLEYIKSLGSGADVASLGELKLAKETGFLPEKIEFTGPGKTLKELSFSIEMGIASINVESIPEINKIIELCQKKNKTANVGIRLNPRINKSISGIRMGGDTQFGISEDDVEKALELIQSNTKTLNFTGFHTHLFSQVLKAEVLLSNFKFILEKVYEIAKYFKFEISKINFGGGWGIDMFGTKPPLDLSVLKKGLSELFATSKFRSVFNNTRFIVEPGRFLVAECGLYLAEVIYHKKGYQKNFLIVDGGMHQHFSAAGGIGQVIRRNYEIDFLTDSNDNNLNKYTVSGSLCISDDILANDIELNSSVSEGDIFLFFNSGAYAFSASPLYFLSHPLPDEILI